MRERGPETDSVSSTYLIERRELEPCMQIKECEKSTKKIYALSSSFSIVFSLLLLLPFFLLEFFYGRADSCSFAFSDFLFCLYGIEELSMVEGPAAGVVDSAGFLLDFFGEVSC